MIHKYGENFDPPVKRRTARRGWNIEAVHARWQWFIHLLKRKGLRQGASCRRDRDVVSPSLSQSTALRQEREDLSLPQSWRLSATWLTAVDVLLKRRWRSWVFYVTPLHDRFFSFFLFLPLLIQKKEKSHDFPTVQGRRKEKGKHFFL